MKHRRILLLGLALLTIFQFSCTEYNKILKSGDNERKKDAAVRYYAEDEYIKSLTLLEDVIPYYKLTPSGDSLYFMYCMANYKLGDYYLAGYYFKRFIRQYPNSKNTEEAQFLSAMCSVNNSPDHSLDQTETLNALDELQIFIDLYPESNRIDTCNVIMDKLRGKLEKKRFDNCMLYYKTENYKAAVVAFEAMLEDYPESTYKETVLFTILESRYLLAINSIESKKKDRLSATLKSYSTFVAAFPESDQLKDAENIKEKAVKELEEYN